MIVVKQMIRRSRRAGLSVERGAVDDEDVRPAVVVVVEDCDARAGGLDNVFLCLLVAGDDLESKAGFLRDVLKVRNRRLGRG